MRLEDKVSIITGGGGGMGRVAALMFAAQGAKVVVAEYSEAAGMETVDLVHAAGGTATFVKADVSKEADAKAMVDHAVATYGRLDCLYNNAGIMPEADHSVTDTDVDTWDAVMAVNVRGVFLGCKYAIPAMVDGGGGSIINIASFVAILGCSVPQDAYTASKGASAVADPQPRRPVRAEGRPDQRDLPRAGRDAAAHGLAGQGRGGQAAPARAEPERSLRQARGDRPHGRLPRLGRVALDERRLAGGRWRHHRELLLMAEDTAEVATGRIAIGVDVGGSGIKAAVVDVESGRFRSERIRVATPTPSTPDAVLASVARLVRRLAKAGGLGDTTPVGIGLPGVTIGGRLITAANIDPSWVDFPVVERMGRLLKRPVSIINDADAAGIAEMRFGVGVDKPGVVIFLTLGTGVGSGVFTDGVLVPNTEFGQMEIRGRAAEKRSAAAARVKRGLSWKAWTADLDEHLDRIHQLMWPDLMILGGGVSKNADRFIPRLTVRCPVVPALLRNDAGIIGAAIVAAEAPLPDPEAPVPTA